MMEDVNAGIGWVLTRIRHYGGDPNRVYLVGQSCGAQLSMMCLVTQVHAPVEGGWGVFLHAKGGGISSLVIMNVYDLVSSRGIETILFPVGQSLPCQKISVERSGLPL